MATDTMPHTEVARVGFFPRLATYLIDVLTTWVLTGILGGSLWALTGAAGATDETAIAMLPLSAIVIVLAYYTILHAHGRQTVGRRIIGAVVVDTGLGPSATAGPWVGCWPSSSRSLPSTSATSGRCGTASARPSTTRSPAPWSCAPAT